ncbi:MAG: Cyclic di-GMP phosphodiesterase [Syntrophus sp. SKADARSKE-3]|nr:Cyclic di-GMP phosphodiesterase [Syntrophus sp. SKADARSKE-3]
MTIKTIPLEDLKIGMFIVLELAWYEHPFLKSQFLVSTQDELKKIRGLGLKSVKIDIDRSRSRPLDSEPPPEEEPSVEEKPMASLVPEELLTVIHDKHITPEQKANLVQEHSITMMRNLLNSPTAGNIKAVKQGMSEIVDLILRDDQTTFYLINITDHDYYTYTHSVNVGFLAIALAKQLFRNSDNHDLHALGAGFFLHDLGKVKITLDIINKPGKLSDEEMKEMKRHPSLGFFLLQEVKQMTKELKMVVLQHHEKMNGTGYPMGIRGEDIHIYGRICAIADIFDALTSKRPYKNQMPSFVALKLMRDEMVPHHIHKELFEKFIPLFKSP